MKADLILKNGKYLDVKLRKFINGNIAIKDGEILMATIQQMKKRI